MFNYIATFVLGVYIGQEYSGQIPNVKQTVIEIYEKLKKEQK